MVDLPAVYERLTGVFAWDWAHFLAFWSRYTTRACDDGSTVLTQEPLECFSVAHGIAVAVVVEADVDFTPYAQPLADGRRSSHGALGTR
jgi:hypothetical protein